MVQKMPPKSSTYDMIIVGGGTAGCVLANRLSEIQNLTVLVLEAGSDQNSNPAVKIPGLVGQAAASPELNWFYKSTPQQSVNGKSFDQSRGKGLGGSSLINRMALTLPPKSGFDAWSDLGNQGWDWESVVPYLRKFQTLHMPDTKVIGDLSLSNIVPEEHGEDGPIQICYQNDEQLYSIDKVWVQTFSNLGHRLNVDTMSGKAQGGFENANTIDPRSKERSHAGVAYLATVMDRSNLDIVTNAIVEKIVLTPSDANGGSQRVSAIEFSSDGQAFTVYANHEVILCAGVFGNPGILERSGIGDPDHLSRIGISPLINNSSVGENLQDHIVCAVSFELKTGIDSLDNFRDQKYVEIAMGEYQSHRTGPLAWGPGMYAFLPFLDQLEDKAGFHAVVEEWLNEKPEEAASLSSIPFFRNIYLSPDEAGITLLMAKVQIHLHESDSSKMFALSSPGNYVSLFATLPHPLSRGSVHCASSDAAAPPIIDPKYYSHPLDLEVMARHLQLFDLIANTEPMKSQLKVNGICIPDAPRKSLEDRKRLAKQSCTSNYHPCGTCAMKPREKGGVVDPRLLVYGVENLRVCDASIFPLIPRGNILSSVYAVAEKGADIIKEDLLASKAFGGA